MHLKVKKILLALIWGLITVQLSAQKTLLYGKAADYRTKEITFYTIPDPILHQKQELATTRVARDGTFSLLLPIYESTEIYSDLEKFCGTMVVEPGKNYEVALPPFTQRTSAEAHSIYFKPTPFWLGLPGTDNTDLNFSVRSFLTDYNLESSENNGFKVIIRVRPPLDREKDEQGRFISIVSHPKLTFRFKFQTIKRKFQYTTTTI